MACPRESPIEKLQRALRGPGAKITKEIPTKRRKDGQRDTKVNHQ